MNRILIALVVLAPLPFGAVHPWAWGLFGCAVGGILYARFWHWRQTGEELVISYDNGMGLRVERPGRLSGPAAMSGRANPSRGEPWSWTAERIAAPEPAAGPAD